MEKMLGSTSFFLRNNIIFQIEHIFVIFKDGKSFQKCKIFFIISRNHDAHVKSRIERIDIMLFIIIMT